MANAGENIDGDQWEDASDVWEVLSEAEETETEDAMENSGEMSTVVVTIWINRPGQVGKLDHRLVIRRTVRRVFFSFVRLPLFCCCFVFSFDDVIYVRPGLIKFCYCSCGCV